mmetsp:Transcript_6460/g.10689  ORF Transcript_6460/g.10689 Transcript_6460/m.10689 type:complete len:364 (+) Transcript_6460:217-1308(+)
MQYFNQLQCNKSGTTGECSSVGQMRASLLGVVTLLLWMSEDILQIHATSTLQHFQTRFRVSKTHLVTRRQSKPDKIHGKDDLRESLPRFRGGGGGYHNFMNHKPWHPGSMKNLEEVWLRQQEEKMRQAKIKERLRILEEERKIEKLRKEELEKLQASGQYQFAEEFAGLQDFMEEHAKIDVNAARSPYDLYAYGRMILSRELEIRDMDCSGTAMDMAVRLYAVRGLAKEEIPQKFRKTAIDQKGGVDNMGDLTHRKRTRKRHRRRKTSASDDNLQLKQWAKNNDKCGDDLKPANLTPTARNAKSFNKTLSHKNERRGKSGKKVKLADSGAVILDSVAGLLARMKAKDLGLHAKSTDFCTEVVT